MNLTRRPRLLDLCSGQGGAARGYMNAGFEVDCVDIEKKHGKRCVHGAGAARFFAADALEFLRLNAWQYDAIHISPPCQRFSIATSSSPDVRLRYPDLIGPARDLLEDTGLPWVIENVKGAPLHNPTTLCWSMFNDAGSVLDDDGTPLRMERHRLFESNVVLDVPRPDDHDRSVQVAGCYGGARRDKVEARVVRHGGYVPSKPVQQRLMGIDWMTQRALYESIPPVYTEWIGNHLRAALQ